MKKFMSLLVAAAVLSLPLASSVSAADTATGEAAQMKALQEKMKADHEKMEALRAEMKATREEAKALREGRRAKMEARQEKRKENRMEQRKQGAGATAPTTSTDTTAPDDVQ